jgi:hypothetical protein
MPRSPPDPLHLISWFLIFSFADCNFLKIFLTKCFRYDTSELFLNRKRISQMTRKNEKGDILLFASKPEQESNSISGKK